MIENGENEEKNINNKEIEKENIEEIIEQNVVIEKNTNKKKIVIATIVGIIIAIILLLLFSPYKMLFETNKMTFLKYILEDINNTKEVSQQFTENKFADFLTQDSTKVVDIKANYSGKELSGTTILDKDFLSLKLNNINEKYLLLKNKDLDELWNKFGLEEYELPSKLDLSNNSLMLNKSEQKRLLNFAIDCLTDIIYNLDEDNFLAANNAVTVNGILKEANSIELKLSETELMEIQKQSLEKLLKSNVLDMIIDKSNAVATKRIDKKEIEDSIKKYIAYIDYAVAYYNLQDKEQDYYIIYRMYFDDNVIAREITEKYTYQGSDYEDVIISLITDADNYYELKVFNQEDYTEAYYNIISDKVTLGDNKQKHLITFEVDGFRGVYSEETQEYNYLPINTETIYNLTIEDDKLSFVDENNIYNFVLEYNQDKIDAEFKLNSENPINIFINAKNDGSITQEKLISEGAVVINDQSKEALTKELNSLISNLS